MLADLVRAIGEDGFQESVERTQYPKKSADGKSDDYSAVQVGADAILCVWFGATGYTSSSLSIHYVPTLYVSARLIDAKTKQDIYFKVFCVGYKWHGLGNVVELDADPRYRYVSYDELMAKLDESFAGLVSCADVAAVRVGSDLRFAINGTPTTAMASTATPE